MKTIVNYSRWLAMLLCMFAIADVCAQQLDPLQAYIDSLAREQAVRQGGPNKVQGTVVPVDQLPAIDLSKKSFRSYLSRSEPLIINASAKFINGTISAAATFAGNGPLLKVTSGVTVMVDETAAINAGSVSSSVCTAAVGIYDCSTFIQNGNVTAPNNGSGVAIFLNSECDSYQYLSGELNGTIKNDNNGTVSGIAIEEAYAVFSGSTLTFYYDANKANRTGMVYALDTGYNFPGWYDNRESISTVVFNASFAKARPTTTFGWFSDMEILTSFVGMRYLNTSNVTDMQYMFEGCSSLTSLDVSSFDTSNVTEMDGMFGGCSSLTSLDISSFDTSNVTNMSGMFVGCSSLTSLDLNNFNTSNVVWMSSMFEGCSSLTSLDVSSFDTSNADLSYMFNGCSNLTSLDVSSFDTSNVTNMSSMFYNCSSLTDLTLSSTMENLDGNACLGVGTTTKPCTIHVPDGFDFGVSTTSSYFQWKSGYFTLGRILGDVNDDGVLSISDPVCLFGWLLEIAQPVFVESVADYNQDTYVTVSDGVAIIADLRSGNAAPRRYNAPALTAANDALHLGVNKSGFGVALDNESTFTAFSLDITLPEGETLRSVTLDSRRSDGHTLSWRQLADGTYRVLCFSPDLQPLVGHEGVLLTFETDGTFSGSVSIDNIRFSDPTGQEKVLAPVSSMPTGIHEMESETVNTPRYTIDGRRISGTQHGVYIYNGKKIINTINN